MRNVRLVAAALLAACLLAPGAARAERSTPSVSLERGRSLLLRGRFPAAANALRDTLRSDPRRPAAWRCLAVAYEAMGHAPEAVRAYRRYLELSPGAADVEIVMARVARLVRDLGWDPGRVRRIGDRSLFG